MTLQSPRLVGEAALAAGKASQLAKYLKMNPKTAAQIGLASDQAGAQNGQYNSASLAPYLMGGR
jgi:hypothetical protein